MADRFKHPIVLIVDDEFAVLEVLSMALESEGFRVYKAGDGVDALRVLVQRRCDLVICDEVMPAIGGAQLLDAMRAEPRLKNLPAILMVETGSSTTEPLDRAVKIIQKPINLPDLIKLVDEALAVANEERPSDPAIEAALDPVVPPKPRAR